jgi:hypothetical protein
VRHKRSAAQWRLTLALAQDGALARKQLEAARASLAQEAAEAQAVAQALGEQLTARRDECNELTAELAAVKVRSLPRRCCSAPVADARARRGGSRLRWAMRRTSARSW